jgi:nitroreductase/NAD-dependent dihydropyrimidine dehydrogenase PreA subunit
MWNLSKDCPFRPVAGRGFFSANQWGWQAGMGKRIVVVLESCFGCGLCVRVCPTAFLRMAGDQPEAATHGCIGCGHCAAVCPTRAIEVEGCREDLGFRTFAENRQWLGWGEADVAGLVRLMRSRRSCRHYQPRAVPLDLLKDLVAIGTTAPSASNRQSWTFTIVAGRSGVETLGAGIADFYRRLNRLAASRSARMAARLFRRDALGRYYRHYYKSVVQGLQAWDKERRDILFHGAPAAIIIGSEADAGCPAADALMAAQNILLAAHALGLGSCMIGYAVEAMRREPAVGRGLGLSGRETVQAVIALGYPDEEYSRVAGRKPCTVRVVDG